MSTISGLHFHKVPVVRRILEQVGDVVSKVLCVNRDVFPATPTKHVERNTKFALSQFIHTYVHTAKTDTFANEHILNIVKCIQYFLL